MMDQMMHRLVARLNIQHFQMLLSQKPEETKRQTLLHLIAEEEARLRVLDSWFVGPF